jgi:hypothetical protein
VAPAGDGDLDEVRAPVLAALVDRRRRDDDLSVIALRTAAPAQRRQPAGSDPL